MNEKNKNIALYLRLSQEDENAGESGSISNQRDLLYNYISTNSEFVNCTITEFADDGYSGTNFNRPAVTDMLKKVKDGKIDCILVKDFSRFGRNFIEVGDYIEQVFPFLGVRFIAVNNNYDNKYQTNSSETLDMAFKNLINELYSKDMSKKVRSAKQAKMRKGDFMSSGSPFGYRKNSDNKNRLEIDPIAAEYVRKIFELCSAGNSTITIASVLNSENIPTPLVYKRSIGQGRKWNVVGEENCWTRTIVLRILRDERYTGTLISGKRKIEKIGSKISVKVSQKDWIVVPDTHEAIVSRELFNCAQRTIGAKEEENKNKASPLHLFAGKIKCGHCHHMLRRRDREQPYFYCETIRYTDSGCSTEKIYESELVEIILCILKKYIGVALYAEAVLNEINDKNANAADEFSNSILLMQNEIVKMNNKKVSLYEDYKEGRISKSKFLDGRQNLEDDIGLKKGEIENAEQVLNGLNECPNGNRFIDSIKKLELVSELTPALVQELISVIRVYNSDLIDIEWKFQDDYEKTIELMDSFKQTPCLTQASS